MRKQLGQLSDIEIVNALVEIEGLKLLDVGCGPGDTARQLAKGGATVVGVEPDPVQAQRNREAEQFAGLTLVEGRAEALPQQDDSMDGVFFFRSLHHVAADAMDSALEEANRVVRTGGFVFALEPSVEGSHTELMHPFHDESELRTLAQKALERAATRLFPVHQYYKCVQRRRYENYQEFVTRFASLSFMDFTPEKIDTPATRQSFEAARTADGYIFEQPILIDLYRVR